MSWASLGMMCIGMQRWCLREGPVAEPDRYRLTPERSNNLCGRCREWNRGVTIHLHKPWLGDDADLSFQFVER
eukprot:8729888-Pyramimonas_sp.AAC.1